MAYERYVSRSTWCYLRDFSFLFYLYVYVGLPRLIFLTLRKVLQVSAHADTIARKLMWGKHFKSMYDGSMYGAGVAVFAVWGYVIGHAHNSRVELNVKKLSDTLGGDEKEIQKAIDFLCAPDPRSRWKEHGGRRLIPEDEYQYFVPSWAHYAAIRSEEDRKEQNRRAQTVYRAKKKGKDVKNITTYAEKMIDKGYLMDDRSAPNR